MNELTKAARGKLIVVHYSRSGSDRFRSFSTKTSKSV